ncbi:heme exporter protein CcmD [Salinicola peritrichatus]|uniref:heme exporter protein CcmD n=1 Tax=Salinicola peritrichatus TaxID=1267424 RepID=UPI000DA217C0|nr:heme exporter protein CcmD [Salinicola peritrichatus]
MAFDSFSALLAMGGYAKYVWPAWGLAALLLLGFVCWARHERRQLFEQLRRRRRREARAA